MNRFVNLIWRFGRDFRFDLMAGRLYNESYTGIASPGRANQTPKSKSAGMSFCLPPAFKRFYGKTMKPNHFKSILITSLAALSVALFFIQYVAFHDLRDTFFYMLQDIAFLPVQALLVTLVLERLLRSNEKQGRLNKQNMVIGVFFSQTGVALLKLFYSWDSPAQAARGNLIVKKTWEDAEFKLLYSRFANYKSTIQPEKIDFNALKKKVVVDRSFLLGLLENQNLLEHEQFTDLLWATFHLLEELMYRDDFSHLSKSDRDHLAGDIDRVYASLICQWIMYMQHLKNNYPYLFSLAMRTNPFDVDAHIEVQ